MKPFPSSSLIIATYNWPQALELCLMSVMKQVEMPTEVIIADDGSKDETRKVVEAFKARIKVPVRHVWQPDEGFQLGKIRNKAMASANTDYLVQVDGDLILHPHFMKDHLEAARSGHFIGGSRVLLAEEYSKQVLDKKILKFSLLQHGLKNKLNGLHLPAMARGIGLFKKEKGLYNLRGCNMSFWKKDIVAVNGYNESISGWGREDTELVIRLYNNGLKRVYFKLQGIVYHIFHKEYDRSSLLKNDEIVKQTLDLKLTHCKQGIDQYL